MRRAAALLLLSAALAFPGAALGGSVTVSVPPAADAGLPFLCDWGYAWEERCYRDEGDRLPVGGVDDKAWRAALRFPLAAVPAGARIESATLVLSHDGACVAPRRERIPCGELGYVLDVHRILSPSWTAEREVEIDVRPAATAVLLAGFSAQRLEWDVTALVRAWHAGLAPNRGVLVKLQDGDEDYGYGGPYVPSADHPVAALRPRLVVTAAPPG